MKRRNFVAALFGGLVVLPLAGKAAVQSEPKQEAGTWVLTHKESRSGLRCTDVRIVINDHDFNDNPVIADYLRRTRGING